MINTNDNIKDWRGRDFRIVLIVPVTGETAASMMARGWEPCVLTLEYQGRTRTGYQSIVDGSIHEALRFDGTESGGGGNNAART